MSQPTIIYRSNMKALTLEKVKEDIDMLRAENERDYDRIERLQNFMSNGWQAEIADLNTKISDRYYLLNKLVLQEARMEAMR